MSSLEFLPCPLCGNAKDFLPLRVARCDAHIQKYGDLYRGQRLSQWQACGSCGFVHQNPRPSLQALSDFYTNGHYHPPRLPDNVTNYLEFAKWYFEEKIEYALAASRLASGHVFEIGVGLGGALRLFADRGWTTLGIEPDPSQAKFSTDTIGLRGVRQGIVDDAFALDTKVDLVFTNHAFEHFADLQSVMRALSRTLKPGGYVFTAVPTYYDNRSRLSKLWMNSAHYSLFTHRSLNQLFSRYGLEEVSHTYRGWRKEVDDLWHVARYTGIRLDPAAFHENAREVRHYINVVNPIRSLLYAPIYAGYAKRVQLFRTIGYMYSIFRKSPRTFFVKVARRLGKLIGIVPTNISRP